MNNIKRRRIVVLGGGSAGWIAANYLRHHLPIDHFEITLIESKEIGIIGVGEGSTPHLKQFFNMLDIDESEWMPRCSATYKTGISFINWTRHTKTNRYFHPFPSPIDQQTASVFLLHCLQRHRGENLPINPDEFFLSMKLAEQGLSPKTKPGQQVILNYAYHFDSSKLGTFLSEIGVDKGIHAIDAKVVEVISNPNGNVTTLLLDTNQVVAGDFFIDASGFSALLLQKHLAVGFDSFTDNLMADRAVAIPSPLENDFCKAETQATALSNGWMWRIPLTNRWGNGYVFSSDFIDSNDAEKELRAILHSPDSTPAKHLKMKVGQAKQHWKNNVIAIGLSQGFIEPLEATALHLVLDSLGAFIHFYKGGKFSPDDVQKYNNHVTERYNGIRDYIVAHYKMNTRADSEYWLANSQNQNISDRLRYLLDTWHKGKDITPVLQESNMLSHHPAVSWYCLLSGYGAYQATEKVYKTPTQFTQMQRFIGNFTAKFKTHKESLIF